MFLFEDFINIKDILNMKVFKFLVASISDFCYELLVLLTYPTSLWSISVLEKVIVY
jgi:hypothetical protein